MVEIWHVETGHFGRAFAEVRGWILAEPLDLLQRSGGGKQQKHLDLLQRSGGGQQQKHLDLPLQRSKIGWVCHVGSKGLKG